MHPSKHLNAAGWFALGAALGLSLSSGSFAEDSPDRASRGDHPPSAALSKEASSKAIDEKLDQLLATQQSILQRFDAVLEELRIVKIRCTS